MTIYKPGTTVILCDDKRGWPVLINQAVIRPGGYVAYEVSWLTDSWDRMQRWVESAELRHADDGDTIALGWFHPLDGRI